MESFSFWVILLPFLNSHPTATDTEILLAVAHLFLGFVFRAIIKHDSRGCCLDNCCRKTPERMLELIMKRTLMFIPLVVLIMAEKSQHGTLEAKKCSQRGS